MDKRTMAGTIDWPDSSKVCNLPLPSVATYLHIMSLGPNRLVNRQHQETMQYDYAFVQNYYHTTNVRLGPPELL